MKSLFISYLFCAAGFFTPFSGIHRFYLGKPLSGFLYLITWGFFGIGTIIDLIRMPFLVDEANLRMFLTEEIFLRLGPEKRRLSSPEKSVLTTANKHNGVVTVQMVSLESELSLYDAKKELERLYSQAFCQKDVDEDGNEIYIFSGLKAKKPLV